MGKGFSITGLILGIVSCVLAWFPMVNIAALAMAIIGLVLAVKGKKEAQAAGVGTGLGTAGLVLSIIGLVLSGIGLFTCTICAGALAGAGTGM